MGDVKLLGVLAMFVLPPETASYKFFLFTVAITATVHAIFLSRGDLRRSLQIPLAPAILCGTIATLILK
jgi:Flp pilus assembly protein protease CpaA